MKYVRLLLAIVLIATLAQFSFGNGNVDAQEEAPRVVILPVNNASFLPGAKFDFRVEVHAAELPADFAVTVNGTPAGDFFAVEGVNENWEFGGRVASYSAEGTPAADFALETLAVEYYNPQFGKAVVAVEGEGLTITLGADVATLEATDNVLVYTVAGGAADGQTLTFGLNADGALTGFSVLGQNFGVLTSLPTKVQSIIWRQVTAPVAGEYTVEVVAGGATTSAMWYVRQPVAGEAQNVILFVADGMTIAQITAARMMSRGYVQGLPNGVLAMENADAVGLAHTSSIDSPMMDSANTASALNTGHIGSVNSTGSYSDSSPDRLDDPRVETLGEMLKRVRGMSVGVVTTADFSDATPAAVFAHGRDRSTANRAAYIAQAFDFAPEVFMGGGGQYMLPQSAEGSRRSDDRDFYVEFADAGYTTVTSKTELDAAFADGTPERLLGVFHRSDMNVWLDRNVFTDNASEFPDQPGLVEMTLAAIEVLSQNPNGFYLEVEAASVDKQMHPLDQERALADLIEFDNAIAAAVAWAEENAPNTLIVITADHGHGYEVYGTVDVEKFNAATDDLGRTAAIGIYNGAKYPTYSDANGDNFPDDWNPSIVFAGTVNNHPAYTEDFQVSPIPRVPAITVDGVVVDNPDDDPNGITMTNNLPNSTTGVHTLQDVPVFAFGPGAEYFDGTYHQREVFFGMAWALGLDPSADGGRVAAVIAPAAPATAPTQAQETESAGFPANAAMIVVLAIGLVGGFVLGTRRKSVA